MVVLKFLGDVYLREKYLPTGFTNLNMVWS